MSTGALCADGDARAISGSQARSTRGANEEQSSASALGVGSGSAPGGGRREL